MANSDALFDAVTNYEGIIDIGKIIVKEKDWKLASTSRIYLSDEREEKNTSTYFNYLMPYDIAVEERKKDETEIKDLLNIAILYKKDGDFIYEFKIHEEHNPYVKRNVKNKQTNQVIDHFEADRNWTIQICRKRYPKDEDLELINKYKDFDLTFPKYEYNHRIISFQEATKVLMQKYGNLSENNFNVIHTNLFNSQKYKTNNKPVLQNIDNLLLDYIPNEVKYKNGGYFVSFPEKLFDYEPLFISIKNDVISKGDDQEKNLLSNLEKTYIELKRLKHVMVDYSPNSIEYLASDNQWKKGIRNSKESHILAFLKKPKDANIPDKPTEKYHIERESKKTKIDDLIDKFNDEFAMRFRKQMIKTPSNKKELESKLAYMQNRYGMIAGLKAIMRQLKLEDRVIEVSGKAKTEDLVK